MPCYSYGQKLSKLAILRIACNYILSLAQLAELDYSSDHSSVSFSQCVEQCTRTLQAEGRSKKRKVRWNSHKHAFTVNFYHTRSWMIGPHHMLKIPQYHVIPEQHIAGLTVLPVVSKSSWTFWNNCHKVTFYNTESRWNVRKCASLRKVFDGSNVSQRTFGDIVEECLIADRSRTHTQMFSLSLL